jgi:hypothetical protein
MDASSSPPADSARPDVNRLWQHGRHEERLFHDRLNYFSAIQVGLLGVFAILYHKEPAPGVFALLTAVGLAVTLRAGPKGNPPAIGYNRSEAAPTAGRRKRRRN